MQEQRDFFFRQRGWSVKYAQYRLTIPPFGWIQDKRKGDVKSQHIRCV
jgi:hypothetical protein